MRGLTSLLALLPLAAAIPHIPLGYKQILFYDIFDAPALDPARWTVDTGTAYPGGPDQWGTGEVQTYTTSPANLFLADNLLHIVPRKDNAGWTSARIESAPGNDFACPEGGAMFVEARIKLGDAPPETQAGIWPAFWLLGAAFRGVYTNWPSIGELDILEAPNGAQRNWNTAHCGSVEGGPCNEPEGLSSSAGALRGDWRLFSIEIVRSQPQRITWFVDRFPSFQLTEAQVGDPEAWRVLVADPKMMLLNVAVGGALPDGVAGRPTPDGATRGGEDAGMLVDYVVVFGT